MLHLAGAVGEEVGIPGAALRVRKLAYGFQFLSYDMWNENGRSGGIGLMAVIDSDP